jgi:hypothetical protein
MALIKRKAPVTQIGDRAGSVCADVPSGMPVSHAVPRITRPSASLPPANEHPAHVCGLIAFIFAGIAVVRSCVLQISQIVPENIIIHQVLPLDALNVRSLTDTVSAHRPHNDDYLQSVR